MFSHETAQLIPHFIWPFWSWTIFVGFMFSNCNNWRENWSHQLFFELVSDIKLYIIQTEYLRKFICIITFSKFFGRRLASVIEGKAINLQDKNFRSRSWHANGSYLTHFYNYIFQFIATHNFKCISWTFISNWDHLILWPQPIWFLKYNAW